MSWKTSTLVRSEILPLFGKTFTADHMHSRHRCEKLRQKVQTVLSQKERPFPQIFFGLPESTQNFARFEKRDQLDSLNILEVIDPNKCGYFNVRKLLF